MLQMQDISERSINQNYPLRVYFHVIRKPDGTGGQIYSNVDQAFQILNNDFNSHHIYFVWNDSIDYINDIHYNSPSDSIFNINSHTNGIDIYLYPDEITGEGRSSANGIGVNSEYYVAGKFRKPPFPSLITSHIVSHEMGHVLFLWHTHHGTDLYFESDSTTCAELVNGSNSDICGDYIMDTPADPGIYSNVDPVTCQWLGGGQDENGDYYQPDTRQIMSYTDIRCMTHFSSGQSVRMRNAIESLPHLQTASVSIHGPTIPSSSSVYYLENLPSVYSVSWAWKNGSSVIIIQNSPLSNQCTISNSFKSYINDVLVATISKGGNVITAIEKPIRSGANFAGTYKQEGGTVVTLDGSTYYAPIPETAFADNASIYIHREHKVTLKSSLFTNSTVTSSGPNPPLFLMQNGDSITFYAPTTTQAAVYTFTGTNNNGYDVFRFTVRKLKDSLVPVFLGLTHSNGMLSLFFKNESDEVIDARDLQDFDIDVIVANIQTGKTVYQSSQKGEVRDISTRNWESGIYIVQAIVEGQQLTNKITINQ